MGGVRYRDQDQYRCAAEGSIQDDRWRNCLQRPGYQVVRIKFERPRLTSFSTADNNWTIAIGDTVLDPTLVIVRNTIGVSRAAAVAAFERPQSVHRIADPDAGDMLLRPRCSPHPSPKRRPEVPSYADRRPTGSPLQALRRPERDRRARSCASNSRLPP
jgi:hypothetical protein